MGNFLESIWNTHLYENKIAYSDTKKKLSMMLSENEKILRTDLNPEQIGMLETIERAQTELFAISERDAFIKGVRFATRFITEALRTD